jgi:hypothetical protein
VQKTTFFGCKQQKQLKKVVAFHYFLIAAKLTQAAESVRMTLRDHIILADEQYYSFKDNKKL